jgi:hypothetical protein
LRGEGACTALRQKSKAETEQKASRHQAEKEWHAQQARSVKCMARVLGAKLSLELIL